MTLADIYAALLARQQPLDAESAKAIYSDRESLYVEESKMTTKQIITHQIYGLGEVLADEGLFVRVKFFTDTGVKTQQKNVLTVGKCACYET